MATPLERRTTHTHTRFFPGDRIWVQFRDRDGTFHKNASTYEYVAPAEWSQERAERTLREAYESECHMSKYVTVYGLVSIRKVDGKVVSE